MLSGWIKLYRKTLDSPVWGLPPAQFKVWITILLMANNTDRKWFDGQTEELVTRGSFVTSQDNLASIAKVTRKVVRRALQNLDRIGAIRANSRSKRYTRITVVNFEAYQAADSGPDRQEGQTGANRGPSEGHNVRMEERKNERKGSPERSSASMAEYTANFSPDDQIVLRQTVQAIATTRKSGCVAPAVIGDLASDLSKYPADAVIRACRIYVERGYAADGKNERYLLGIVRGESERGVPAYRNEPASADATSEFDQLVRAAGRDMAAEVSS